MSAPSPNSEMIERELATLGEDPPTAEELALAGELASEPEDVATVARLAELAEPIAFEDLSELETHRSWRSVEQRLARPRPAAASDQRPNGASPRRWLFAAVGVAAAAAIVLIIVVDPFASEQLAEGPSAAQVADVGAQARATLEVLDDGASDTERAEQRLAAYRLELEEQGG